MRKPKSERALSKPFADLVRAQAVVRGAVLVGTAMCVAACGSSTPKQADTKAPVVIAPAPAAPATAAPAPAAKVASAPAPAAADGKRGRRGDKRETELPAASADPSAAATEPVP